MNKARRHELKMLKFKRRLKNLRITHLIGDPKANIHSYRSHGAPCSCFICSHSKYKRAKMKKDFEGLQRDGSGWQLNDADGR